MLKKITLGLGNIPGYFKQIHSLWPSISIALVLALGLGAFAWSNQVQDDPFIAILLAMSVVLLVGHPLILMRRLQRVCMQRDQALAQVSAQEWQMCVGLKNQDSCIDRCAARRVHALQKEVLDLHARKKMLQVQAHHDNLTGLANRLLLADRFHFAAERAKRSNQSFALLMIDLNDFKCINDHHGHAAGDAVLVTLAGRLVRAVRASDTVARLGGDEFVLIIEAIESRQELAQLTEKLLATLSDPVPMASGAVLGTGASVGVAVYPQDGVEMNDLLQVADLAMYECKSTGLLSPL